MQRNEQHQGRMWNRAHSLFPTCANQDAGLLKLEKELVICCESRGNGSPKNGCWSCPRRVACENLWGQVSTRSSSRKLLPEEIKEFKERFALIKEAKQ